MSTEKTLTVTFKTIERSDTLQARLMVQTASCCRRCGRDTKVDHYKGVLVLHTGPDGPPTADGLNAEILCLPCGSTLKV